MPDAIPVICELVRWHHGKPSSCCASADIINQASWRIHAGAIFGAVPCPQASGTCSDCDPYACVGDGARESVTACALEIDSRQREVVERTQVARDDCEEDGLLPADSRALLVVILAEKFAPD